MEIRLASDLQPDSIVDGEGIRTVIWTQGCPHNCKGCHNPQTHDFNEGVLVDIDDVISELAELKNQSGITFSGGDPMCQPSACLKIAKYAKNLGMNVWCYTGYTFEQLINMNRKDINAFLSEIDVLVDGKFVLEEKSYDCVFRGSKNQRIIDVKKSLEQKEVFLVSKYYQSEETKKNYIFI